MAQNEGQITSREAYRLYQDAIRGWRAAKNNPSAHSDLKRAGESVEYAWGRFAAAFTRENREYIAQQIIDKPRRPK